jgi:hypothetical protein
MNLKMKQRGNIGTYFSQKSSKNPVLPVKAGIFLSVFTGKADFLIIRQLTGIHVFDTL